MVLGLGHMVCGEANLRLDVSCFTGIGQVAQRDIDSTATVGQ